MTKKGIPNRSGLEYGKARMIWEHDDVRVVATATNHSVRYARLIYTIEVKGVDALGEAAWRAVDVLKEHAMYTECTPPRVKLLINLLQQCANLPNNAYPSKQLTEPKEEAQ